MPYHITIENFSGPLDLLSQLIEKEELDITKVSLSKVTDAFLEYIAVVEARRPEEMADFLVLATKLLWLKSGKLLPEPMLDEELGFDLETQLKIYRDFYAAAKKLHEIWRADHRLFLREAPYKLELARSFEPGGVTAEALRCAFDGVLERLKRFAQMPETALKRVVSLAEKMRELERVIHERSSLLWSEFVENAESRGDLVVGFIALLELVKQRVVHVEQETAFCDMMIKKTEV